MEGDDLVALLDLLGDEELAPALPAAGFLLGLLVETVLESDEVVCEHSVRGPPGIDHLVVRGVAEDLLDSAQETLTDDGILVCGNAQANVLVANSRDGRAQCGGILDVGGISPHGVSKGCGLHARGLVGQAEDVLEFGVVREQVLVEERGDSDAMLFEGGDGRLDDFDLLGGESGLGGIGSPRHGSKGGTGNL